MFENKDYAPPPEPQDCEPGNPNQMPAPKRHDSGQQYG